MALDGGPLPPQLNAGEAGEGGAHEPIDIQLIIIIRRRRRITIFKKVI